QRVVAGSLGSRRARMPFRAVAAAPPPGIIPDGAWGCSTFSREVVGLGLGREGPGPDVGRPGGDGGHRRRGQVGVLTDELGRSPLAQPQEVVEDQYLAVA